jgi:hypothetical protein
MPRIAGLTTQTSPSGKVTKVTIDMKRWGHLMEDVLDAIAVERAKISNQYTPWEVVKKRLDKKHSKKNDL